MDKRSLTPRVFISYCWENFDTQLFQYITHILQEMSESEFELIIDKKNQIGDDIGLFMKLLEEVDAVIILLTPEYKSRIINRRPSGVYTEFKIIYQRYLDTRSKYIVDGRRTFFDILPVIISGNRESSIPEELQNILSEDLRGLYPSVNKEGGFIIPKEINSKYYPKFENISQRVKALYSIKKESYQETWKELFRFLFKESKAGWHLPENRKYVNSVFVKTKAYKRIRDQEVWFLVGRKGSGKTTITDILPILENDLFDFEIRIEAEDIYLQPIYNLFFTSLGFESDTKNIIPRTRALQFGWDIFLSLTCVYYLVEKGLCNQIDCKIILTRFVEELLNSNRIYETNRDLNIFFVHSFFKLQEYIDFSFKHSRTEVFGADLMRHLSIDGFRNYVIPYDVQKAMRDCTKSLGKKILLTFDGFDTVFDEFRKESLLSGTTEEYSKRSQFESFWLSSLIQLILNKGVGRDSTNPIYKNFFYCITIPNDRFHEVRKSDRDSYRHFHKFSYLNWTGIELAILLRKRLEELSGYRTNQNFPPEERLNEVLSKEFSLIPQNVEVDFHGTVYKMPLFIYILRHTFWRPRDILFFYVGILSLFKERKRKNMALDIGDIQAIIRRTNYKIIESEFVNEFETTIFNIQEILGVFKNGSQMISFSEIGDLLSKVDFEQQTSLSPIVDIKEKIEYLFKIGFLGFLTPEIIQKEYKFHKHSFSFNDGVFIWAKLVDKLGEMTFVIHPIFSEYLNLNTYLNKEMVLVFDWEYLRNQEEFNHTDI